MNMEVDKDGRLSKAQLEHLPTKRLMALLKKVRPNRDVVGFELFVDGNPTYQEGWDWLDSYFSDIKKILKDRPHIK